MPSAANVRAPFTLVCSPRSGSSLLQAIFHEHPDCQSVGETQNILFSAWYGLSQSEYVVVRTQAQQTRDGYRQSAAAGMHSLLVSMFPSDRPHWMQKPIGLPAPYWFFAGRPNAHEFMDWYWNGMQAMFPEGKVFTLLRDPRDVVISAMSYFRMDEPKAWDTVGRILDLVLHEKSLVSHGVDFDALVAEPEREVRRLFEFLGLSFEPRCLSALGYVYVQTAPADSVNAANWSYRQPRASAGDKEARGFSRGAEWNTLSIGKAGEAVIAKAELLRSKLGR